MDSDKVQQLNSAIEAKLSEIMPDLDQLFQKYLVSEGFEVHLKIDLFASQSDSACQSENNQTCSEMVRVFGTGCHHDPTCDCTSCDSVAVC